jgi:CRISPR/Cas system-associated exonuclease Cas4 (RecB family)
MGNLKSTVSKLYDGKVSLKFEKGKHWYSVKGSNLLVPDDKRFHYIPSSTTIGGILGKPALVQWSANECASSVEKQWEPGVTYDELEIQQILKTARFAHNSSRDKSAARGTLIHSWIEKFMASLIDEADIPRFPKNVNTRKSVERLLRWWEKQKFEVQFSEQKIYSILYNYAGTLDIAVYDRQGRLVIIDVKTGKGDKVYPEYYFQTASYAQGILEEFGERVDYRLILGINRDTGKVNPMHLENIEKEEARKKGRDPYTWEDDLDGFLGLRMAYRRLQGA